MLRLFLAAAVLISSAPADAEPVHTGRVTEIVDGDTVLIDPPYRNSNQIRLVGIQAPKLPLGRKGFEKWPLADESKAALSDLTLGKQVALSFGGAKQDRYRRWLAHLTLVHDGQWVQGEMLRLGMARVYSFPDNRSRVEEMYALERAARRQNRGIWALDYYAVRASTPAGLLRELGTFQLIEGRVREAADVKGTIYLNFGRDWRSDFTVAIRKKHRKAFADTTFDLLSLQGTTLRVRGWLKKRNGPMIDATHPEQIEFFE